MRRIFRLIIVLAGIVAIVALLSPWLVAPAVGQRGLALPPSRHLIEYAAWDGRTRTAVLLLPAGYTRSCASRLPLVISPHGRGESPASIASSWGRLPTRDDFAVICPAGEGERLPNYSCAAPGQISDLARMPAIVQHALPWVRIASRHVYAVGPSMGGQEALMLAAQYPDRIAAAASIDGLADLAAHFEQMPRPRRTGRLVLRDMVVECGGTPAQRPRAYALRSPLSYVANLATDGVPLELWWSRCDQVVVAQATRQSGLLYRSIKRLNPAAPVREVVTSYRHCVAFCPSIALGQVVSFLRPGGRWRSSRAAPPPDFRFRSSRRRATPWGYGFRVKGVPDRFWEAREVATGALEVETPVPMVVTVPCSEKRRFACVMVGDTILRLAIDRGSICVELPPGETQVCVACVSPPRSTPANRGARSGRSRSPRDCARA